MTIYEATPGPQALDEDEPVCHVDDDGAVGEDRQETRRPARRLTREAADGEEGQGRGKML